MNTHYRKDNHCPTCNNLIADDSITCRKDRKFTNEQKAKMSKSNTGKKQSIETLLKLSALRKGKTPWNKGIPGPRGELAYNWQGGKWAINSLERNRLEMKIWKKAVFERDDYTCKLCRKKGIKLNAHHIRFFSTHPKLRTVVGNGITLCEYCHKFLHREKHLEWMWDGPIKSLTKLI